MSTTPAMTGSLDQCAVSKEDGFRPDEPPQAEQDIDGVGRIPPAGDDFLEDYRAEHQDEPGQLQRVRPLVSARTVRKKSRSQNRFCLGQGRRAQMRRAVAPSWRAWRSRTCPTEERKRRGDCRMRSEPAGGDPDNATFCSLRKSPLRRDAACRLRRSSDESCLICSGQSEPSTAPACASGQGMTWVK